VVRGWGFDVGPVFMGLSVSKRFMIGIASSWYPYLNVKTIDTHI